MKVVGFRQLGLTILLLWGYLGFLTGCEQTPSQKKSSETPTPKPEESKIQAVGPTPIPYQIDLSQVSLPSSEFLQKDTLGLFFCLDISGSMGGWIGNKKKIDISKEAMQKVFTQIAAYAQSHPEKKVQVGLCSFDHRVNLLQPLEIFDQNKLERMIQPLQPSGNTAIGEAILLAFKEILKSGVETKAILVMTDGENNRGTPPELVVEAIKQNRNNQQILTGDIDVFLIAFDVNASVFEGVKKAGAIVVESRDQKSLEGVLSSIVEQVLLEAR